MFYMYSFRGVCKECKINVGYRAYSDLFKEPGLWSVFPSRDAVAWKERVMEMK